MVYTFLLLETKSLLIDITAIEGLSNTKLRFKKVPRLNFLESHQNHMRLSSHSPRCEIRHWDTRDESTDHAHFALNKFGSLSITLSYNALPLITFDYAFPHIFEQTQSLPEFFSQSQCALSIATFISKVLEHRDSLLTFTCIA